MKVLLISAYPSNEYLGESLVDAFAEGVVSSGLTASRLSLPELEPKATHGSPSGQQTVQQAIAEADHLVFFSPSGSDLFSPEFQLALNSILAPGFAFQPQGPLSNRPLLVGKTAEIITTTDTPFRQQVRSLEEPSRAISSAEEILERSGIVVVRTKAYGPVVSLDDEQREDWIRETRAAGRRLSFANQRDRRWRPGASMIADRPIEGVLDELEQLAGQKDSLSFGHIMDMLGPHSFAPVLLLIGLIMLAPGPADLPGVPVFLGLVAILVAAQLVLGRQHLWIPNWMESWNVSAKQTRKMASWMRRPAHWLDRVTKPRFEWLIQQTGSGVVGISCILIAMTTPILEFIPFSANLAGATIAAFGIALLAKDGLLAGVAIALSLATALVIGYHLFN